MDLTLMNILLSIAAGIVSIFAPCILPILPGLVIGYEKEDKYRPILLALGITITFTIMGVISAAFGHLLGQNMFYIEKIGGGIILILGILILLDINLFKKLTHLHKFRIKSKTSSRLEPLILGLSLGIIWIPCTGPILSSVLAVVASKGQLLSGIVLLLFYSLGFSLPIIALGYFSKFFRDKISALSKHYQIIQYISGGILVILGLYIIFAGTLGFF